ncbi:MAG: ribbon-helix-helix domain-containing protein [Rickettsiales bacterium]
MSKRAPLSFNTEKAVLASVVPSDETRLPTNKQTKQQKNTKTRKQINDETKKGREGRQFIAGHVLPEAAKQFKLLAVQQNKTTQDMLIEAINDLFAKHGLSRIA